MRHLASGKIVVHKDFSDIGLEQFLDNVATNEPSSPDHEDGLTLDFHQLMIGAKHLLETHLQ